MSEYDRLWREINGLKKNVRGLSQPQLAFSTVEDGYVTWRDADGNARLRIGLQEDGTQSILHMSGPKPPTPSAPTVTVDGVVVTVDHDGSNIDGAPLPADYRRRIVYAGFASDMSDAVPVATIEPPTGGQAVFMAPGSGTVYVAVRTETHATMLSDFSEAVPVEVTMVSLEGELEIIKDSANGKNKNYYSPEPPKEGVEGDVWFDTSIDPETGQPKWGLNLWDGSKWVSARDSRLQVVETAQAELAKKLDAVVVSADGGNKNFYSTTAPVKDMKPGDLWFDGSKNNMPHRWDGKEWVSVADERVSAVQKAQEALSSDLAGVRKSVDGKTVIRWEPKAPSASTPGGVTGDTWHQYTGGAHVGTWRWDGSKWVQQSLDPVMIPKLDIGTGTFGELDGARLKVGTVGADKVLVGSDRNLFPDGDLTRGGAGWPSSLTFDPNDKPNGDMAGSMATAPGQGGTNFRGPVDYPVEPGDVLVFECWLKADKPGSRFFAEVRNTSNDGLVRGWSGKGSSTAYPVAGYKVLTEWTKVTATTIVGEGTPAVYLGLFYFNHSSGSESKATVKIAGLKLYRKVGSTVIADGAITTEKIAVGAITAESGVIGSLDLGKATVGELDGSRIKAGTLTVGQLLSGTPTNVLPGADNLAVSNAGWTGFGRNVSDPSIWLQGRTNAENDGAFELSAGVTYTATTDVKASVDGTMWFWQLMGQDGQGTPYIFYNETAGTAWRTATAQFTVPKSGRYKLKIWSNHQNGESNENGYQWWRNPRVSPAVDTTLIKDGAITTNKIATGAITAESGVIGTLDAGKITVGEMDGARIKANTIGTDLLKAGAVTAKILDATAIDGKTITGATIRTGISGARVQLDATGIHAYNPNSVETVTISAVTGEANITGNFSSGLPSSMCVDIDNALWRNAQWSDWDGTTVYATGTGVRMGIPDSYGSIGYASVLRPSAIGVDNETGEETPLGAEVKPALIVSGPGRGPQDRADIGLYENGSVLLRSKDGAPITLRTHNNRGDRIQLVGNGSVVSRSSGGAVLLLTKEGQTIVRSGLGGKDSSRLYMYDSVILQTRGGDPAQLRTGNDRANLTVGAGGGEITLRGDNVRLLSGSLYYQGHPTSGATPNMYMNSSGWVARATSSRRYKHDIQDFTVPDALLDVPFRTWIDKGEYERNDNSSDGLTRIPGLVAEEVAEACPELVIYDDKGRPDALAGDRIGMAALTLIRRQRDRINVLEERLNSLEGATS